MKQKTTQKLPGYYPETAQKIIALIKENSTVTQHELAAKVGISANGIKYQLTSLKKKRLLKRIGPDKGGY